MKMLISFLCYITIFQAHALTSAEKNAFKVMDLIQDARSSYRKIHDKSNNRPEERLLKKLKKIFRENKINLNTVCPSNCGEYTSGAQSIFSLALSTKSLPLIDFLISQGADLNTLPGRKETPLMFIHSGSGF